MKKFLSFQFAINASLFIYGLFVVFHLVVITGIMFYQNFPVQYLWGGRMETRNQLLVFELISVVVQVLCIVITLVRSKSIPLSGFMKISKVAMWLLFGLFLLNTVGNILAKTAFEKWFAIVTAVLAILTMRIAMEKEL